MAGIWDKYNPAAVEVQDKPWYDDAKEVGRQVGAGFAVDLPRMTGQAARWAAEDGSAVDEWGRSVVEDADARAGGWEPDLQGRGGLASTLIKGGRAIGPMAPAIAASLIPGGQFVAPAVAAGQFGASSAQDTYDKLVNQGVSPEEATRAGWVTGAIQGAAEAAATALGMKAFAAAKPLFGAGAQTTAGVAERLMDTAVLKPLAKGMGINLLVQPATEVAQDLGTEFNERSFGAAPEDAWQIAKDSAQGGLGLTLLLGPLAAGSHVRRSQAASQLRAALESPDVAVQAQARDLVAAQAAKEGVRPEDTGAWLDNWFAQIDAADAANAEVAAQTEYEKTALSNRSEAAKARAEALSLDQEWNGGVEPVNADTLPGQLGLRIGGMTAKERKAYPSVFEAAASEGTGQFVAGADGVEREITALEAVQRGLTAPMGEPDSTEEHVPNSQGAAAVQAVLDSQARAVQAAQQAPTPEQQRLQAVKQKAAQVAAQAQAQEQRARTEFGITKGAALAAYGDLEAAHTEGLIDDEQFATAVGMLSGNATGLGKVRKQLAGIRKDQEAARLQAEQAQRVAQADAATAAADIAKLQTKKPTTQGTANAATPANPGTQASPTPGAQAAPQGTNSRPAVELDDTRRRLLQYLTDPKVSTEAKRDASQTAGLMVAQDVGGTPYLAPVPRGATLTITRDPQTGAESIVVPPSRATEAAVETEEGAGFRRNLIDYMDRMSDAERYILGSWLGVRVDEVTADDGTVTRTLELQDGEPPSYAVIGQRLRNSKTGEVGMTKQAVEKAVKKALKDLGVEGVSPKKLRERLSTQLAGTDLETLQRNVDAPTAAQEADAPAELDGGLPAANMADEAAFTDDDVATPDEPAYEADFDAVREGVERGTLLDFLTDDLKEGRVLQSDIDELRGFMDHMAARGKIEAFDDLTPDEQADAVRKYARARAAGAPEVKQAKELLKNASATPEGPAPVGSDTRGAVGGRQDAAAGEPAVQPGPGARVQTGAESPAGAAADPADATPVVGDGAKSAAKVVTKKKRTAVRPADPAINREVLDAANVPLNQEVLDGANVRHMTLGYLKDPDGAPVPVRTSSLDVLSKYPAIKRAIDQYRRDGFEHLLGAVQTWAVAEGQVGWEGVYTLHDGKSMVVFSSDALANPVSAEWTLHHELGHAVDEAHDTNGGLFSSEPEFNVSVAKDRIIPMGAVFKEVVAQLKADPDSRFAEVMQYPLDRSQHGTLNAEGVRQELFAQLWATYNTSWGRDYMEEFLPQAHYFMEKTYAELESKTYVGAEAKGPGGLQGAHSRQAAQASTGAQNAAAGQGNQRGQVPAGDQGGVTARFNRTPPQALRAESAVKSFLGKLKTGGQDGLNWALLRASFTKDLAARAASVLPSVTKYIELVEANAVEKTRAERDIEAILDRYSALPAHERGTGPASVNAFIQASTTQRKWAYKPEYLPDAQVDPDLEVRFNGLSAAGQALVREVFRHGHENLQALKQAVNDNVASEFDALIAGLEKVGDKAGAAKAAQDKQKSLREFQSLEALNGDWPYAPLRRFGNHVVVGMSQAYLDAEEVGDTRRMDQLKRDPKHYFVAFRETKDEARKERDRISGMYAYADNFAKDTAHDKLYGGRDMLGAFRRLRDLASNTQDEALSGKAGVALNRLMVDLQLTLLAEQSARQAERQRLTVAGADADMMRAFATQGRASAHFIASLKSNGAVQEQMQAMRNEADARVPGREQRREFYNELLARHVMGMDYQPTPFVDRVLATNSVWMLLTSPAYFLSNATQPFVMSLPVLAGRHGYAKSAAALRKAYVELFPLVKDGTITQDDYSKLPADVRDAVKQLADGGYIDITLESDLGRWRSEESDGLKSLGTVTSKMRGIAQTVEAVNRLATAVAAVRLEQATGSGNAVKYAGKVIYDTHGDYTGFNAPRVMRAPVGRLLTQFRKFQLIQLSLFTKLTNQAFKGANAEERSVGRQALAWSLGHMFLLGGLLGMPGAQAIGFVLRHAFGDDEEPDNPELTLRRMIGNDTIADLLTKGVPKMAGLDLSGRLGAGGMLSLLPYADVSMDRKGYESAVMGALGPFFGGLLPRAVDGVGLIGQGDYWRGLEQLLPKGLADFSKAVRFNVDGVTSRRGDQLLNAEDVSELATLGQLIGLPTTQLTDRQFRSSAVYTSDKHFQERTTQIKRQYVEAVKGNDTAAMQEARAKWQAAQEARREYGYKAQPLSELLKAPQEQAKRDRQVVNGVLYKRDNRGLAEQLGS